MELDSGTVIRSINVQKPGRYFSLNPSKDLAAISSGNFLCIYKLEDFTLVEKVRFDFPLTGITWGSTRGTIITYGNNEVSLWNFHLKKDPINVASIPSEIQSGQMSPNGAEFYCLDVEGNLHVVKIPQIQMQDILFRAEPQIQETDLNDGKETEGKPKKKQKRFDQLPQKSSDKLVSKKKKVKEESDDEVQPKDEDFDNLFAREEQPLEEGNVEQQAQMPMIDAPLNEEIVFAPNHTEWKNDARWIAFTNLGKVISRKVGDSINVDIEFHDIRSHRPVRFVDDLELDFCSIDSSGAVFGGNQNVKFVPFSGGVNWTTKHTWLLQLDLNETVKSVALRDEKIIVLTSRGYLRPMSTTAIQLQPIVAPNGAFCLILANNGLLILCKSKSGFETLLFDLEINHIASFPFCGEFLWAGNDDSGNCFGAMDKDFVFYILESNGWKPVFKPESSGEKYYWPVSFGVEGIKTIVSSTLPVPVPNSQQPINIETVPFLVPLASLSDPIVQINSTYLVNSILKPTLTEKELKKANNAGDKLLLELFQMAIKCDQLERALQLTGLLTNPKSLEIAIQLARHARLITLVDKINSAAISANTNNNILIPTSETTVQNNTSSQHLFSKPFTTATSPTTTSFIQDSYVMPNTIESSGYDLSQLLANRENHNNSNRENINTFTSGLDSQATQLPTFSSQPRKSSILSDPFADDVKKKDEPVVSNGGGGGYMSAIHKLQQTWNKK